MPKIRYTRFPLTSPQTGKLPTCCGLVTDLLCVQLWILGISPLVRCIVKCHHRYVWVGLLCGIANSSMPQSWANSRWKPNDEQWMICRISAVCHTTSARLSPPLFTVAWSGELQSPPLLRINVAPESQWWWYAVHDVLAAADVRLTHHQQQLNQAAATAATRSLCCCCYFWQTLIKRDYFYF